MFQFSFQFADALAHDGHHVQLLTGPDPELSSANPRLEVLACSRPGTPTRRSTDRPLRRPRRAFRALRLLDSWRRVLPHVRRTRPDIVQFGELRYALDTAAFVILAALGGRGRLVDVAHNPLPYDVNSTTQAVEKTGRVTRALLRRAYRAPT